MTPRDDTVIDVNQVPDAHGLSADSMRGSEHYVHQPIYANVGGMMQEQDREPLSYHQRGVLAVKGLLPDDVAEQDAVDPADIPATAPTDQYVNLERRLTDLEMRLAQQSVPTLPQPLDVAPPGTRRVGEVDTVKTTDPRVVAEPAQPIPYQGETYPTPPREGYPSPTGTPSVPVGPTTPTTPGNAETRTSPHPDTRSTGGDLPL